MYKTTASYRASWIICVNLIGPGRDISCDPSVSSSAALMHVLCYTVCSYLQLLNVSLPEV